MTTFNLSHKIVNGQVWINLNIEAPYKNEKELEDIARAFKENIRLNFTVINSNLRVANQEEYKEV